MAALASHLEGDIVGGVALDLEGSGREVVEVLVEELEAPIVSINTSRNKEAAGGLREKKGQLAGPRISDGSIETYVVSRLGNICECWDRHDGRGIE